MLAWQIDLSIPRISNCFIKITSMIMMQLLEQSTEVNMRYMIPITVKVLLMRLTNLLEGIYW